MSQPTRKCYATRRAAAVAPDLACSDLEAVKLEAAKHSDSSITSVSVSLSLFLFKQCTRAEIKNGRFCLLGLKAPRGT